MSLTKKLVMELSSIQNVCTGVFKANYDDNFHPAM